MWSVVIVILHCGNSTQESLLTWITPQLLQQLLSNLSKILPQHGISQVLTHIQSTLTYSFNGNEENMTYEAN